MGKRYVLGVTVLVLMSIGSFAKLPSIYNSTIEAKNFTDTLTFDIDHRSSVGEEYLLIAMPIGFAEVSNENGVVMSQSRTGKDIGLGFDPYFFFRVDSTTQVLKVLPSHGYVAKIERTSLEKIESRIFKRNVFTSIFIGIMLSMFLYNLFLFVVLKDTSYIYYLGFVFFIAVAQISLLNFDYYLFESGFLLDSNFHLSSGLSGVFAILFASSFLNIRKSHPKLFGLFLFFVFVYALVVVFTLLGLKDLAHNLVQFGGVSTLVIIPLSFYLGKKGVKGGNTIGASYSLMVAGGVLLTLRDLGVIGDNLLTNFTMPIGVALQVILLSIALANQINSLRAEKDEANQRVLSEIQKNKELIQDQNITLEKKVKERTAELQKALDDLKAAQSQLVQSEKMASLGTLTAGIAHEINNPINFVAANVLPLRENIDDITTLIREYKSIDFSNLKSELKRLAELEEELELDYMLNETKELVDGIEEGAKRTYAIVEGLTTFSRGDGGKKSDADVNRGIRSTISVLKSRLNNVNLVTELQDDLPLVSCQIGKINQVMLNLINNAVDALEEKNGTNSEQSALTIQTQEIDGYVKITVSDNANGMTEETKNKVMEPFYTTKPVGKGTGLGLSISYSIIEDHEGTMELKTEVGVGSTFSILLPIVSLT